MALARMSIEDDDDGYDVDEPRTRDLHQEFVIAWQEVVEGIGMMEVYNVVKLSLCIALQDRF